jgi:hypothetical protein
MLISTMFGSILNLRQYMAYSWRKNNFRQVYLSAEA